VSPKELVPHSAGKWRCSGDIWFGFRLIGGASFSESDLIKAFVQKGASILIASGFQTAALKVSIRDLHQ
jgi:hypothetical protein